MAPNVQVLTDADADVILNLQDIGIYFCQYTVSGSNFISKNQFH